jgi:hypothetical protein
MRRTLREEVGQAGATLTQHTCAQIHPVRFEQVITQEHHRYLCEDLRCQALPPNAVLQRRKREGNTVAEGDDFPIQHGALGEQQPCLAQLRKAIGDQLFPARPEIDGIAAPDKLRPDAIPLPFREPVVPIPQLSNILIELVG